MTEVVHLPIHETPSYSLFFELEYEWVPASGDGWNEPREPAHWELQSRKLYSITEWHRPKDASQLYHPQDNPLVKQTSRTDIPNPPPWLDHILDDYDPTDELGRGDD